MMLSLVDNIYLIYTVRQGEARGGVFCLRFSCFRVSETGILRSNIVKNRKFSATSSSCRLREVRKSVKIVTIFLDKGNKIYNFKVKNFHFHPKW